MNFASRTCGLAAALWVLTGAGTQAGACGQCIEDKVAATYDYEVLTTATRRGHVVVYTEIRGPAAGAGMALRAYVAHALAEVPGIDLGTVRVSLDPPAASFACDPANGTIRKLIETAAPRLAQKQLSLVPFKVARGPHSARPTRSSE